MSLMRVSDPSQWCSVELDETPASTQGVERLLAGIDDVELSADDLDPAVAAPLEALLAHLAGRHHTTTDEVRAALRQAGAAGANLTAPAASER